jgi:hypothetical protein
MSAAADTIEPFWIITRRCHAQQAQSSTSWRVQTLSQRDPSELHRREQQLRGLEFATPAKSKSASGSDSDFVPEHTIF